MNELLKSIIKNNEFAYNVYYIINSNHIKKNGRNNVIRIGKRSRMKCCRIDVLGNNNKVTIGDDVNLNGMSILIIGDGSEIEIGNKTIINASKTNRTIINAVDGSKIIIGDDCLLSNNIEIHTSDYHSILNQNGERINYEQDVCIGNHVWVGLRSIILKGTKIEDNCIVGANSLLSGVHDEKNSMIVGSPAKVIKQHINWESRRI